ncbi:MAG TPA: type I phosphomannose isomerase catalytic subunit [Chthoniobacterales bacterium]|nr:type I phosphomannose isomerase catalytic subunit [Chthoniobacterales bacterium]
MKSAITSPLTFEPVFQERIWGGRKLAELFGKPLPAGKRIGESWEIVDRQEAQSVVANGPLEGKTLHQLWLEDRDSVFGNVPDAPRFPLLIKLLHAEDKLSLQVHPPPEIAAKLGAEPKTEFWYVAAADPGAEIFVGFRNSMTRKQFEKSLRAASVADHVHTIRVTAGDAMFLPAGRFHAVGAGCVLVEIQQNSDTTYRVFDWNRKDDSGNHRPLHLAQALESINFKDVAPTLTEPKGDLLVRYELFEIQKWKLDQPREVTPRGQFAIVCCLTGSLCCADVDLGPGEFLLLPAALKDRHLRARAAGTTLLRVTIPK